MRPVLLHWQLVATGAARPFARLADRPAFRSAWRALRSPVWPAALAAFGGLVLLLSFQLVVSRAVAHGEHRHAAWTARVQGTWRCNLVRNVNARAGCLAQVAGVHDAASP
jgi:hypothetical protein